jgi:hypothetical protein
LDERGEGLHRSPFFCLQGCRYIAERREKVRPLAVEKLAWTMRGGDEPTGCR